jgi:hypothetical protein
MTSPYVRLHGWDLTSVVSRDGVEESGGGPTVESFSSPGRKDATVYDTGREKSTYSFEMTSTDRDLLEELIADINNAPTDAEFCPREVDRIIYLSTAYASHTKRMDCLLNGVKSNYYYSDVEVTARSGLQTGNTDQGISLCHNVPLPAESSTITAGGYHDNTIDYLYMSGYYDSSLGMTDEVLLTVGEYEIPLCDMLLAGDAFKMDRYGQIKHTFETDFKMSYEGLQHQLGGSTYFDYGTGGPSISYRQLVMGNSAKLYFPFYGPLPVNNAPYIELVATAVVGSPMMKYAFTTDLSDATTYSYTLHTGTNKIWFPNCEGEDFVAIGITTGASASITISSIGAEVRRYITEDELHLIQPGDEFTIKVSDGEYSNHKLTALRARYRDLF